MSYLARLAGALREHDGEAVASLLNPGNKKLSESALIPSNGTIGGVPEAWIPAVLALGRLQALLRSTGQIPLPALDDLIKKIDRAVLNEERWAVPVLLRNCNLYLKLARSEPDSVKRKQALELLAPLARQVFRTMVTDRNEDFRSNRAWGRWAATVLNLRAYYSLGLISAADSLLRTTMANEKQVNPSLKQIQPQERAAYLFYRGIGTMAALDYGDAYSSLQVCWNLAIHNKAPAHILEQILIFILPVALVHENRYPSASLWDKYPKLAELYRELFEATRYGNLKAFNVALARRRTSLVKNRLYLVVEQLNLVLLGRLVRRTSDLRGRNLPLKDLIIALKTTGSASSEIDAQILIGRLVTVGRLKARLDGTRIKLDYSS